MLGGRGGWSQDVWLEAAEARVAGRRRNGVGGVKDRRHGRELIDSRERGSAVRRVVGEGVGSGGNAEWEPEDAAWVDARFAQVAEGRLVGAQGAGSEVAVREEGRRSVTVMFASWADTRQACRDQR